MINNLSLIRKNKQLFNYKSSNKKIILVEYNSFHGSHLCQALLANFFKKKNSSKIIAYFNYCLIVSPLKINFFQKIKWKISSFLSLSFKGIYKSFGVEEFIRPVITEEMTSKASNIRDNFFKKKVFHRDIVNFKINKIWIGDLIYDTYLKSRLVPTINIQDDDFKNFFKEFLELFFYWEKFFKLNKVTQTIGVHSCYSFGLPLRISAYNNIPGYVINTRAVIKIDKKIPTMYGNFKFFKKDFLKIRNKKQALTVSKKNLDLRFSGISGVDVGLYNREKSSFSRKKNKKDLIQKNSKIKILICTHDFLDSIHVNGKNFFPDFYLWIDFLGKLSNKKVKDYDFYIKSHPNLGNKYEKYQKYTNTFVNNLLKKYPKIKKIPNNTSHHQIIAAGINYVLTVYGSVGIEYACLGIPVINASRNNPHINYNFNINPKNQKDYIKILSNLKKRKFKINQKEVLECYFMKHFFWDENWLFDNYKAFMSSIGGYHNIHTFRLYKYWYENIDEKFIKKINYRFNNFVNSYENRLSNFSSEKNKNFFQIKQKNY